MKLELLYMKKKYKSWVSCCQICNVRKSPPHTIRLIVKPVPGQLLPTPAPLPHVCCTHHTTLVSVRSPTMPLSLLSVSQSRDSCDVTGRRGLV